jgi:hypothetical protein
MRVDFLKNQFSQWRFSKFELQPIELLDTQGVVSGTKEETQCEGYSVLDRHSEKKHIWVYSEIIQVPLIVQPVKQQLTAK